MKPTKEEPALFSFLFSDSYVIKYIRFVKITLLLCRYDHQLFYTERLTNVYLIVLFNKNINVCMQMYS